MKLIVRHLFTLVLSLYSTLKRALTTLYWWSTLTHYSSSSTIDPSVVITNPSKTQIGKDGNIRQGVIIQANKQGIKLSDRVHINPYSVLFGQITIKNDVMIAPGVMIAGGNHTYTDLAKPMLEQGSDSKGVTVGNDVWIGANAVILDGVTLNDGCIVGAGAVVSKDVEKYTIVTGVPARKIKQRG